MASFSFFKILRFMNNNIKKLLQKPEVKEIAIAMVGVAVGFAANKLVSILIKRNIIVGMIGRAVQVGVTSWISSHPEWIEGAVDRLLPEDRA